MLENVIRDHDAAAAEVEDFGVVGDGPIGFELGELVEQPGHLFRLPLACEPGMRAKILLRGQPKLPLNFLLAPKEMCGELPFFAMQKRG